jgi:hypothetical protein
MSRLCVKNSSAFFQREGALRLRAEIAIFVGENPAFGLTDGRLSATMEAIAPKGARKGDPKR